MENDFKNFACQRIDKGLKEILNNFREENEKIEIIYKNFCKKLTKEQNEELESIVHLYNNIKNEENIFSYKIGFQDGIKILK